MQDIELEGPGAVDLPFGEPGQVVDPGRDRAELEPQRPAFLDHLPLRLVDRDRDRAERLTQLVQAGDVVEVCVREQDRLDGRAPAPRLFDDEVGFEVGVDDHRVVGVLVFDQVGVGTEAPVGRDLDVEPHKVLRTTWTGPASR